jgi:GDP-D-mannose 3', 5'-epimerase
VVRSDGAAADLRAIVVAGAGGFIGGHLVRRLLATRSQPIVAIDVKPLGAWFQLHREAENRTLDLRLADHCDDALRGAGGVFNLASDMGGMGFIEANRALCMMSVLINTHPRHRQNTSHPAGLKESDAYPADPEDGYGWEKLFSERMCRHFSEDFRLETRVARYHNIYGPHGTWTGGREKAPAAICRKLAVAKLFGPREIEIWGDGEQSRSFTFVDDCLEGTLRLCDSGVRAPINVGSAEVVTINGLVSLVEEIAGVRVTRRYNDRAPTGVRGRSSDNQAIREALDWEPQTPLVDGLVATYAWVFDQVANGSRRPARPRAAG